MERSYGTNAVGINLSRGDAGGVSFQRNAPVSKATPNAKVGLSAGRLARQRAAKCQSKGVAAAGSAASDFHKKIVRNRYSYTVAVVGPKSSGKSTVLACLRDGGSMTRAGDRMGRGIEQPSDTPSGLAHTIIHSTKFAIDLIDTPGAYQPDDDNPHYGRREVITAINQSDACMLVLSSVPAEHSAAWRTGEIQEFIKLIKVLDKANRLIVVITKLDQAPENQVRSRFMKVRMPVHRFIDKTFGVESKKLKYVGISGETGENVLMRVDKFPVSDRDRAPFLKHYFDMWLWPPSRAKEVKNALRIPVQDVYEYEDEGGDRSLVAVGRVETGELHIGDKVSLAPGMVYTEVFNIIKVNADPSNPSYNATQATAGESVHVFVGNEVTLGSVIGLIRDGNKSPHMAYVYEALVTIMADAKDFEIVEELEWVIDYTVVSEVASFKRLKHKVNPKTLKVTGKPNPKRIRKGESVICDIQSDVAVAVETYEDYPPLGRFLLRNRDGRVVAVGIINELLEH